MVAWWRHLSILSSNTVSSRRLKVLFAINCLNIGGAPSVVVNQLKGLDKNKFEPYLLTLYPSKAANFLGEVNTFLPAGQQRHFKLKNRSIFDLKTLWQIYRFLRQERFDIVYTHLFLTNLIVRALAVLAGVKTIVSFEHSIYPDKSRWQIMADWILARFTDLIIVPTPTVSEFTSKQEKIDFSKFRVLSNPVVIPKREAVNRDKLKELAQVMDDSRVVLTIGRFSVDKDHPTLLKAAELVHQSFPSATFLIVGHGPGENKLRDQIKDLNLSSFVRLLPYPDLAKNFLYLADIFVLSSVREGQPVVLLEAMAAGLPVVATNVGGVKEVVVEGQTGFIVPSQDPTSLALRIGDLLKNKEVRENMSKQALKTFEDKFNQGKDLGTLFLSLCQDIC